MTTIFVSGGCSAENEVVDVGLNGIFAYGSGSNVLLGLVDSNHPNRLLLPHGPAAQVHSVRILPNGPLGSFVFAASADCCLYTWSIASGTKDTLPSVSFVAKFPFSAALNSLTWGRASSIFNIVCSDINGTIYSVKFDGVKISTKGKYSFGLKKVISTAVHDDLIFAGISDNSLAILQDNTDNDDALALLLSVPGHSNWINSMDLFFSISERAIFLATGSSDRTVRVWRVAPKKEADSSVLTELIPSKNIFNWKGVPFVIDCETILYGHEAMIQSVRWDRFELAAELSRRFLISAASDHTLIIWKAASGGWQSVGQLGEIANIGTIGGDRSFGFFSGLLSTWGDEEFILTHLSTGSIVKYSRSAKSNQSFSAKVTPLVTGHISSIESCSWQRNLGIPSETMHMPMLLTTGKDKTSRLWSHWETDQYEGWFERARPQIHGYEMQAISFCDQSSFLSAGDEKILRSFSSPEHQSGHAGASHVIVPALGLSNKAAGPVQGAGPDGLPGSVLTRRIADLDVPPTEYDLSRLTLWPETDKLYGHGLEVYSLAVSSDGRFAASANKSSTSEDAAIRFWHRPDASTGLWKALGTVKAHSLTAVRLYFSPDDQLLLSISRDRHWALIAGADNEWRQPRLFHMQVAHSRIIWSAAWVNNDAFVTASRDGFIKTWIRVEVGWIELEVDRIQAEKAITSVAIFQSTILAAGLEDGTIIIYQKNDGDRMKWFPKMELTGGAGGATSTINELAWMPGAKPILCAVSNLLQLFDFSNKF